MARVEVLNAGLCRSFARLARACEPWRWEAFPAAFGLIHPRDGGAVLFDTGYSRHVPAAMSGFPFALYRDLLPITLGLDAVESLRRRGIAAEAVETVVISHFHPDHVGGLRDFPAARLVCSRRAWETVRGRSGLAALRRGFLAALLPADFERRVVFAEDLPVSGRLDCGSESFTLLPLEGHAAGQLGMLVPRDGGGRVLFAADAVWRHASLEDGIGPHPLAMVVHHDRVAYGDTLRRLVALRREDPGLVIVPSHDPGDWP